MEQEVARFLQTQLGYNASSDVTLSANCRGNLKGLWEFVISNYKTPETKRHIQHVLDRHRKEQEAARKAPEQQREAAARRQRLTDLMKQNASLEKALTAFQSRAESQVQEATDQACEKSLLQHAVQEIEAETLLIEAFVQRGQQLLPELQAQLSGLRYTLDYIKARRRAAGSSRMHQALQQQVASLCSTIQEGLNRAVQDVQHQMGFATPATDLQQLQDQHTHADRPMQLEHSTSSWLSTSTDSGPQQAAAAITLQQLLQVCKLLQGYRLPPAVLSQALLLLQTPPGQLLDACAQQAQHNLQDLTARLDEAEREMLAPLQWPASSAATSSSIEGGQLQLQHKPDQHHWAVRSAATAGSSGAGSRSCKLPWASGLQWGFSDAGGVEQQDVSLPPEVRVKVRLRDHIKLHIETEQTLQRVKAAQQQLDAAMGSVPLLQGMVPAAAAADDSSSAAQDAAWEARAAQVYLSVVQLQAQVELLQHREAQFCQELAQLQDIRAVTEEKQLLVKQQMDEDLRLNQLLHAAAEDTMELDAALRTYQQQAAQQLGLQLLPCGVAAGDAMRSAVGQALSEMQVVEQVPVLDLAAPVRVMTQELCPGQDTTGSSHADPVLGRPTLQRLQSAGRQLVLTGRTTTGNKPLRSLASTAAAAAGAGLRGLSGHDMMAAAGSSSMSRSRDRTFGDSAAVAALKGASLLDPLAPLRCPSAVLLGVAERCKEARQLQQQLEALSAVEAAATSSRSAAAAHESQLQAQVAAHHQQEQVHELPRLQSLLEQCQAARAFAREELAADLRETWEMPAMHLVPQRRYQGKNCSEWLHELQLLNAQMC